MIWLGLFTFSAIYLPKVRWLPTTTPTPFNSNLFQRMLSFILYVASLIELSDLLSTCMVKYFFGWNRRSEFSVQLHIKSISYCSNEESCSVFIILKSLLSSENKNKSECFTKSINVFRYK